MIPRLPAGPACGDPLPPRPRGWWSTAALLTWGLVLAGCPRESLTHFPTLTGATCRVELGMPREHVLLRCGPPCGGGPVGAELTCDVYGSAEICYRDGTIASLQRLGSWGDRFPWCGWGADGAPAAAP